MTITNVSISGNNFLITFGHKTIRISINASLVIISAILKKSGLNDEEILSTMVTMTTVLQQTKE